VPKISVLLISLISVYVSFLQDHFVMGYQHMKYDEEYQAFERNFDKEYYETQEHYQIELP